MIEIKQEKVIKKEINELFLRFIFTFFYPFLFIFLLWLSSNFLEIPNAFQKIYSDTHIFLMGAIFMIGIGIDLIFIELPKKELLASKHFCDLIIIIGTIGIILIMLYGFFKHASLCIENFTTDSANLQIRIAKKLSFSSIGTGFFVLCTGSALIIEVRRRLIKLALGK